MLSKVLPLVFFHFPEMVEAMYEQTPEFFIRFRKNFRYQFCLEEPRVGKDFENDICSALGLHSKESEYCDLEQKHYLLESSSQFQRRGRACAVPCLYSFFSFLIHTTSYLYLNSDTIQKLNDALSYNKNPDNRNHFSETRNEYANDCS